MKMSIYIHNVNINLIDLADEIRTDDFQINPAAITKMDIPEQVKQLIIKCCSNIKNRLKIDEVVGCLQALDKFYNK
ncbi:Kinase [Hexamita inflata]|uniref:Kinase n=1 Tax=Hexamita inflata TaxID=28002 RepID=A0AA86UP31_9EUKA|nr:Kinase [Hexamita inflata]